MTMFVPGAAFHVHAIVVGRTRGWMGSAGGSGATSTALRVVDEEGNESRSVLYSSKAPKNDSSRDVVRHSGVYGCIMNTAARSSAERASAAPKRACNICAIAPKLGFTLSFLILIF
jgi:hypothetical protein